MQTIIVLLNPGQLQNPDLDLRYLVPDRIEEVSASLIKDNGYDYIDAEEGQGRCWAFGWKQKTRRKTGRLLLSCFKMNSLWEMICPPPRKFIFPKKIQMIWKIAHWYSRNKSGLD